MKRYVIAQGLLLLSAQLFAHNLEAEVQPISEREAAAIVASQEAAKEQSKDECEAELQSAYIVDTSVADLGCKKVIFNRLPRSTSAENETETQTRPQSRASLPMDMTFEEFAATQAKPTVNVTLSGEVDEDGISELWWKYEDARYRIFTNANFLYFVGSGQFEDENHRYSTFMMITPSSHAYGMDDGWRPTLNDFTPDTLEFYIMDLGDGAEPDEAAFDAIRAMLAHYAEHSAEMQTSYENRQKLQEARKAYLKANPPKKNRDVIINFRPID